MSKSLSVNALDFDQIKESMKSFLKQQDEFSDYNFEGSGMSVLIDTLSYNAYNIGYYTHMLANESFVNSATLASSMNSHAKGQNYIPRSKVSSKASITIKYEGGTAQPQSFLVPRGSEIRSDNNQTDNRKFYVVDDVYITNDGDNITPNYISNEIDISEGQFQKLNYTYDTLQVNQRFIIDDESIDITSLRVKIFDTFGDTSFKPWKLADDLMQIDGDSRVFYLSANEENKYELFFGNGVYGEKPQNGNFIELSYISSSGINGNGANVFVMELPVDDWTTTINTIKTSDGGLERETVEELRFNIPYHFRRQNRVVTIDDYKNIILSEYRNVSSINVWGGESHQPVTYGKVFICIKPKSGEVLSNTGKGFIKNIVEKYNIPTVSLEILDPDYLYINLEVETIYNPLLTTIGDGEMETIVNGAIEEYNTESLTKFNAIYSSSNLTGIVKTKESSIITTQTFPTFERRVTIIENAFNAVSVNFLNEIEKDTIISNYFLFRLNQSQLYDIGGVLKIRYLDVTTNIWKVYESEDFGTANYTTGIVDVVGVEFNGFYGTDSQFILKATPVDNDFKTKLNNIITINNVNTTIFKDYQE